MAVTADEFTVREKFFPKLARVLARVPMADELVASLAESSVRAGKATVVAPFCIWTPILAENR